MNILIAATHFPPRFADESAIRAFRLAKWLRANAHNVRVVCVEDADGDPTQKVLAREDTFEGIAVDRLSINHIDARDLNRLEYDNAFINQYFTDKIIEDRPDVVHLFGGELLTVSPLRMAQDVGIATAVTLTDYWFFCKRVNMVRSDGGLSEMPLDAAQCARCLAEEGSALWWLSRISPRLMNAFWRLQAGKTRPIQDRIEFLRDTLNLADAVIGPAAFLRDMLASLGVDTKHYHHVQPGYDPFDPSASSKHTPSTALPEGKPLRVGYLGPVLPAYGVHVLIEAVNQLDDYPIELRVFGNAQLNATYTESLLPLAGDGVRIRLEGHYGQRDVARILGALDVVVVPTLWNEMCPEVILEAFAHGVPVIASNLPGMADLVQHETNGLLFKPGDSEDLAAVLRQLLESPQLLAKIQSGISAVHAVKDEMAAIELIYREIIATAKQKEVTVRSAA
jgi:glycosyltransferase involved in cell wall biosynthesis